MGNVTGDAEGRYAAAQRAELNLQKIQSINALTVDENHRSFLNYKRNYDEYLLVSRYNWNRRVLPMRWTIFDRHLGNKTRE